MVSDKWGVLEVVVDGEGVSLWGNFCRMVLSCRSEGVRGAWSGDVDGE